MSEFDVLYDTFQTSSQASAWGEIKCKLTFSLSAGEVLHNNVAKVTLSGEGIQTCNTYYEVRLSNCEANYASSC